MRLRSACVGLAIFLVPPCAFAAPPPSDPAAAREQLKIGYQLAQDGKCEEALPHLTESLRLDPRAITLINLADCEEKTGKLADAMVHWADARSRAAAEGLRPIQEEAASRAAALEPKIPRLTITLASTVPPDATVERDGVTLGRASLGVPLPFDLGPHKITLRARGHADTMKDVTLSEGEKQTLELDVGPAVAEPPPPPPAPPTSTPPPADEKKSGHMSPLVPIGFGVGLAGIAVGTITGVMALGKGSDADTDCPDGHCKSKDALDSVNTGKTLGTVSTIAFIAGGVGVGVGVVGLLIGGKKTEPSAKLDLGVGPSSLFLKGVF